MLASVSGLLHSGVSVRSFPQMPVHLKWEYLISTADFWWFTQRGIKHCFHSVFLQGKILWRPLSGVIATWSSVVPFWTLAVLYTWWLERGKAWQKPSCTNMKAHSYSQCYFGEEEWSCLAVYWDFKILQEGSSWRCWKVLFRGWRNLLCLLETPFCCLPSLLVSEIGQPDEIKGVATCTWTLTCLTGALFKCRHRTKCFKSFAKGSSWTVTAGYVDPN